LLNFRDQKYVGVIAQTTEYSCGAAAIATLLSTFFGAPTAEMQVVELVEASLRTRGAEPSFETGLTAYDLTQASASLGLRLKGYRLDSRQLQDYFKQGGFPVIAHVTQPRLHYLVVVGLVDENLLLCDPGWGRYVAPMSELTDARVMSGVFLVSIPTEEQARIASREQSQLLVWMRIRMDQLVELREGIMP
jgi:predicted double-glycine peptidase